MKDDRTEASSSQVGEHVDEVPEQLVIPRVMYASPREPTRMRLPSEREAFTHKFTILAGEEDYMATRQKDKEGRLLYRKIYRPLVGYVTVGVYPDGRPGELFLKMGKAGGVWRGYDALMVAISVGLQYGIPVEVFIRKFQHMRFEPSGLTLSTDIPIAKSVVDYLARWLKRRYPLPEEEEEKLNRQGINDEGGGHSQKDEEKSASEAE